MNITTNPWRQDRLSNRLGPVQGQEDKRRYVEEPMPEPVEDEKPRPTDGFFARYDGWCYECQRHIEAGTMIHYVLASHTAKGTRIAHIGCG